MNSKIFTICFISLIVGVCLTFSNTLTFARYEPATIKIAQADEMDYRFSEAQEEEMKGEEEDWSALPEEGQDEDENEFYIPPNVSDEDYFKYAPYQEDSEEENYQGADESEEDEENDSLEEKESRR
jgi:hypothetical protein